MGPNTNEELMSVFASPLHAVYPRTGFVTLKSGAEVSELPLYDGENEVFARLSLAEARQWCADNGYRLPTVAELRELHDVALWIAPVTLPTTAMVVSARVPLTTDAINRFRSANMSSLQWARIHDNAVDAALEETGFDGNEPVANVGKCWSDEGALFGWRKADGSFIQKPYSGHGDHHHDYASTTYVARVDAPEPDDTDPGEAPVCHTLGEAVLEAAQADLDAGVHEDLGPNDGKRIREYLKPFGLRPPQNWCSVAVAAWLREACEAEDIEPPIAGSPGAQATMAQLRKAGLFVEKRDITADHMTAGAIVIWKRPPLTWTGHIGVLESYDEDTRTMTTIEGNAGPLGDRVWRNNGRRLDDPLLFGVGRLDGFKTEAMDYDDVPDDEPVHEGSDPLWFDADHLFARWLGIDKLEQPEEDDDEAEWVANSTGLDISSWQRPDKLHWDAIVDTHAFVICRATYGRTIDKAYRSHTDAVSNSDLFLGAYHFVRTSQPWAEQLDVFCAQLDAIGYGPADILPVLDIEKNEPYDPWEPSKLLTYASKMAEVLKERFGGCLLYTSPSVDIELGKPQLFRDNPIWVAHYGVSKPRWDGEWTIWQQSGSHRGPEYGTGSATDLLDLNIAKVLPLCE